MEYPPEIPNNNLPQPQGINHPLILRIPIPILVRPQRVCHTLDRVHDGTSKVVGGVYFPFRPNSPSSLEKRLQIARVNVENVPSTVMRQNIAPIDNRIAHRLVRIIDAHFGTKTPALAFGAAGCHFFEAGEVLFNCAVAPGGGDTFSSLLTHLRGHSEEM